MDAKKGQRLRSKLCKACGSKSPSMVLQSRKENQANDFEFSSNVESEIADGFQFHSLTHSNELEGAVAKLENGDFDAISRPEMMELQAFIEDEGRPLVLVLEDKFEPLDSPWEHFNDPQGEINPRINKLVPSIGRIELLPTVAGELPKNLGTGFVVGEQLVMTNRHVAIEFAHGRGTRNLMFARSTTGEMDFRRERDFDLSDQSFHAQFSEVVMIHPVWDMALLKVRDLPSSARPVPLSVVPPADLVDREVAVIGYPGKSRDRSQRALDLEDRYMNGVFDVKRLAPGEIEPIQEFTDEGQTVQAMTHDSSTLPGNSGAVLIDTLTGHVVGLHFGGVPFEANFAVPTFELARDVRVVDAGLTFLGQVPSTNEWDIPWQIANFDPNEH